ncbi:unnamed protein product [Prunus armeniaca]
MLEKIGLPAKPSLRGNTWVVDASHCQGCTSQFTFINRKHHCRTYGGLFCTAAPSKKCFYAGELEEAARFERHGHKTRAGRGAILIPSKVVSSFVVALNICRLKLTSKPEDEVLNQILGNDRKESGQESNSNVVASMQRASSSASVQIVNKISATMGSVEALREFKRGKELERQADALEIHLRKERKKVLLSGNVAESQTRDGPSESGRRNKVTPPVNKSKDDLSDELKELGCVGKALMLKREGKLAEAEELKRAKVLEKELEEQEFLAEVEDSDDELSALICMTDEDMEDSEINAALQSLGWSQDAKNPETPAYPYSCCNVTEAMAQLKKAKLLGRDLESVDSPEGNVANDRTTIHNQTADKSSKSFTKELLGLKKKALALRREGRLDDAEEELKKGSILEHQLEEIENGSMPKAMHGTVGTGNQDMHDPTTVSVEGLLDPQLLSALKAIGIDDASILSQGPGRPEPSKVNAGKSNNPTQDRTQLEEQIKVEKVKAINLKRAVKQAEALVTLRKAKMLE